MAPNPDSRALRIAEIRRQIADGAYDTPERLEGAVDAYLDRSGKEGETRLGFDRLPKVRHVE
jgi:hypothetical protein